MGEEVNWWVKAPDESTSPAEHHVPEPPAPVANPDDDRPVKARRRVWPYAAAVAVLIVALSVVWQSAKDDQNHQEREAKAATYKGRSGAALDIDSVNADVTAQWATHRDHVTVELTSYFDEDAKYLRIESSGKSDSSKREHDWYPEDPKITLPVKDPLADVTIRIEIGGKSWKEGSKATTKTVRLAPTGVAYDAETGEKLPSDL
ncbi:hypothetical protein [Streptomyces sp. NPDC050738]|uniref:hypothetical protein n=1 Tax=Streptomyces sp. NPDC050738 TaxID=3154744 RepID=UPI00342E1881